MHYDYIGENNRIVEGFRGDVSERLKQLLPTQTKTVTMMF